MNRGRLVFVNRVYWPDTAATAQLLHDLATGLAARGHRVTVLTAAAPGRPEAETRHGVSIQRLGARSPRRRGLLSQACNYAAFGLRAVGVLLRDVQPADTVIALTDPPLLGMAATAAARLKRARIAHWTQDLYPEVAMAVTRSRPWRWSLGWLRTLRDLSWRMSDALVLPGEDLDARAGRVRGSTLRVTVLPNWAPAGLQAPAEPPRPQRLFVVGYSGNFGRVHDFAPLIAAAAALRSREDIQFVLTGAGARLAEIASAVAERSLANVRIRPPRPRSELGAALAEADLHVVSLRAGCEGTVWPSKFYGIVAVHRPILYFGPRTAEVARLIQRHTLGACFTADEGERAARFIAGLADQPEDHARLVDHVRRFAASLPTLPAIVEAWEAVLRSGSRRDEAGPLL